MKRVLLIILLVIVPLQFAWASAGAYCLHEEGATSLHFGHHPHTHTHTAKSDASDSKAKFSKVHLDCSSCHAPANVIVVAAPALTLSASQLERPAPVSILYTSFIPDGPRRPDRLPGA